MIDIEPYFIEQKKRLLHGRIKTLLLSELIEKKETRERLLAGIFEEEQAFNTKQKVS